MLVLARCRATLLPSLQTTPRSFAGILGARHGFSASAIVGREKFTDCHRNHVHWSPKSLRASISHRRDGLSRGFSLTTRRWAQESGRPGTDRDNPIPEPTSRQTSPSKPIPPLLSPRENIYNLPNLLTASRLLAAPAIGYLIVNGDLKWALGLFFYASITDLADGWLARRFHLQTVVGSVIDPMADKLLMTVMTLSLAVEGLLPAYLATLILGRDVALALAAIYYRYASLPAPKTLSRYWDFSLPSAEVRPTTVSKYNTFLQMLLLGGTLALPVAAADPVLQAVVPGGVDAGLTAFQWLVAATTAWSGLSYAVLKDAVRIIGDDEARKARQGRTGRRIIGVLFGGIVVASAWLAWREETGEKVV